MIHTFLFSPSGTTRKYALAMTQAFGGDFRLIDLTHGPCEVEYDFADGDTVLLLAPVYAGRIPEMAAKLFSQIDGHGMKAIVAVVYGNRNYDDALLELADIASSDGFEVIGAGAFIAQHCIFPKVASERPGNSDIAQAVDFIRRAIKSGRLDISAIKGNHPYKKAAPVRRRPKVDKDICRDCGKCARECPAGAISVDNPQETDVEKCISCSRCIVVCPDKARHFGGLKYRMIVPLFRKMCSKRREPEWFIAE